MSIGNLMNRDVMYKYFSACSQPQSNYAVEHFVDGSRLTPERRFRQAVIELDSALEALEDAEYYAEKLNIKIKKLKGKMFKAEVNSDKQLLLDLKINRNASKKERADRRLNGKRKEMRQHFKNLWALEKELGFDKDITEEEIYEILQKAEANYYLIKLATDTAAHMISKQGGPSEGVLLALQQMPEEDISRFQDALNGMLTSMGSTSYVPAIHGDGTIADIMSLGAAAKEQNKQLQKEDS